MVTLLLGTFSLYMLMCLIGLYGAVKQNRRFASATWFVLGSVKPHVMLLPAIALLFSRKWRIIGYAVGFMVIIILISSFILGWNVWFDFLSSAFSTFEEGDFLGVTPSSMINLKGILAEILGPERDQIFNAISFFAFILSGVLTAGLWASMGSKEREFDILFGLTILLGTLFGLHVNPQDGLYIVPPAYSLYTYIHAKSYSSKYVLIFLVLSPAFLLFYRYALQNIVGIQAQFLLMLILLLLLSSRIVNERKVLVSTIK
jgi:hypothetical protein